MGIDRAEQTGLSVAVVGHLALFGALSLSLLNAPPLPILESEPVEVELVTDIAPVTSAPDPQPLAPAPLLAPDSGPPVDATPPEPAPLPPTLKPQPPQPRPKPKPTPPVPQPVPKPTPRPAPKPAPTPKPMPRVVAKPPLKPAAKPAVAKSATSRPAAKPARDVRPTGNLAGILTGSGNRPGPSPLPKPQAAVAGPSAADLATIKRALGTEIGRQLKPKWKAPTGADVDQLVTILSWDLAPDGSLSGAPRFISQGGVTPSNQAQAAIHRDNAIKAVRAAAPFNLPSQHYSLWKSVISFKFDKRLSQ